MKPNTYDRMMLRAKKEIQFLLDEIKAYTEMDEKLMKPIHRQSLAEARSELKAWREVVGKWDLNGFYF